MELSLGPTTVELLAGKAAFLKESKSLIIADLHLGKSATFRSRGLAVPEGTTATDLARLTDLIAQRSPSQLIIAGDLVHSAEGLRSGVLDIFRDWLNKTAIPVILTEGNHDSRAWLRDHRLPIEMVSFLELDGLVITHDPADLRPSSPGISGHLHPGARIAESKRNRIRVAGFLLQNELHLVLPAFSEFTGTQLVAMQEKDQFFTEVGQAVVEIPHPLIRN